MAHRWIVSLSLLFGLLQTISPAAPPVRIMPVGDSITWGSAVAGGYRLPLWNLLTNAGYTVDFTGTQTGNGAAGLPDSEHEGYSGWQIHQINNVIAGSLQQTPDPDVVLLFIGTNDYGASNDVANATNRWISLIGKIASNRPHCHIVAANLMDRNNSNWAISNIHQFFNPSVPGIVSNLQAQGLQIHFTDLYSAVPISDMPDQLHPGAAGYAKMATNWFQAITNIMSPFGTTNAPALVRAVGRPGLSNVTVTFSKPVADSATNLFHYTLDGGLAVLGATLDPVSMRDVTLVTSPQAPLSNYTVTVGGVTDRTAAATALAGSAVTGFVAAAGFPGGGPVATSGVFSNVPEAADFQLVYSVDLPAAVSFPAAATYGVDLAAFASNYTRVAYYLELQTNGGLVDFAWVSLDPMTNNVRALGIPTVSSGALFQQPVTNMNVLCTVTSVVNGTNLSGGSLEFWPSNYGQSNALAVPGASDTAFDWGDVRSSGNYGSMQIHHAAASQTILAFNRWGGTGLTANDLGIGNNVNTNDTDWTFSQSAARYTATRRLQVLVRPVTSSPPALASAEGLSGWTGVVVRFSTPLADDAAAVTNFALSGGLTVLDAVLDPATKVEVRLTTTPQQPSMTYTVTVNHVRERTTNQLMIAAGSELAFRALADRGAMVNVPEANEYTLVYSLNIPAVPNFTTTLNYDVDLSAFASNFTRVAYYLELQTNGGPVRYIWTALDPVTTNAARIGVPTFTSGAIFQQPVTNLDVRCNVPGVTEGVGLAGCNIEFWPNNYSQSNAVAVPGASSTSYDWGDMRATDGNYGSMQLHNNSASQVLFAFNRWNRSETCDLGIGNNTESANPDYTFMQTAARYTSRVLQVYARLAVATNPPALVRATSFASPPALTNVAIDFSMPLQDDATNTAYYALSGGLSVLGAELDPVTKVRVTLTTTPQLPNVIYTATVHSVRDRTTNQLVIATNSTVPFVYTIADLTWDADPATAGAQDGSGTWDGVLTNWWDGAANTNWSSAHPDNALIGAGNGPAGTITVSGVQSVGGITFQPATAGSYRLTGGTLALSNAPVITANADATIASTVAGAGVALVKDGPGTLTLASANTYNGGTTLATGTVAILNAYGLGPGPAQVATGATLAIGVAGVTIPNALSGAGTINANTLGTGTTSLLFTNAASAFAGTINVGPAAAGGGKAVLDNGVGVAAAVNISNNATLFLRSGSNHTGAIRLEGGDTGEAIGQLRMELNTTWSGPVTLAGGITTANDGFVGHNTAGGFGFIRGAIGEEGGSRELSKVGAGAIVVSGTNTYSGGTRLTAGVLDVPELSDVGPSGVGTGRLVFAGGTLRYSGLTDATTARAVTNAGNAGWDIANNVRLTLTGPMTGGGALFKYGVGTWVWASNQVASYGGWRIQRGTLIVDGVGYTNTTTAEEWLGNAAGDFSWLFLTNNSRIIKTAASWFQVAAIAGSTGVVVMTDGEFHSANTTKGFLLGNQANTFGVFHQLGGSVYSGYEVDASYGTASSYGFYNLRGGSLSNASWLQACRTGLGLIYAQGGEIGQLSAAQGLLTANAGTGVLYIAGSPVRVAGRLALGWVGTSRGEVTIDGPSQVTVGNTGVQFNQSGTTFCFLNLNGGVLAASNVYKQVVGGFSAIAFNGGTLRALGSQVLLGPGAGAAGALDAAYVHAGGAFLDTSNHTATVSQNLLAPTGSGVTALPWGGPLPGYLGAPYVAIRGGGGTGATAVALFDHSSGTVTGLVLTSPGVDYTSAPDVTLLGGGPGTNALGLATIGANASGGLTKWGAGTLILAGANTYTGATVVTAGTLVLNGTHQGAVTVAAGAALSGTGAISAAVAVDGGAAVRPGHAPAASPMTVAAAAFADGAVVDVLAGGTGSVLRVTGSNACTVPAGAGRLWINLLSTSLVAGTYTLIDYEGTLQGGTETNLALLTYPPRAVLYLTNNAVSTSIDLVMDAPGDAIRWNGAVDAVWDINTTSNWIAMGGAQTTAYLQAGSIGDAVLFDDAAVANFSVTLATNVSPASVTVSNEANDYALSGGFGIGGAGGLTKQGAARLTLATSNSYSGGTRIMGGTLQAGSGGAFGALGSGPITNDGRLIFNHGDAATLGIAVSGTGELVKEGAGALTLAAFNTYTNLTTANGGTLRLAANAAGSGTLSGPLTINTGATVIATVANALGYAGIPWVRSVTINDGTLATAVTGVDNGWGLTINMTGGSLTSLVAGGYFSLGLASVVNVWTTDHPAAISANLTVRDNITFNVQRGSATSDLNVAGALLNTGAFGILKNGAGVMVLGATNTYTGQTTVNGGTLYLADSAKLYHGAYAASAVLTVRSNAVLDLATWAYSEPGAESLGGLRANNNAIVVDGGTIRMRKTTSYYRGFTIGANGVTLETAPGANWSLNFDATTPLVSTLGGSMTLAGEGTGSLHKAMLGSGSLVKTGSGIWTLTATNTYSGTTVVSNGTLVLNGVSGSGAVTVETNATLGGTGVVRGAVVQHGTIDPGAGIGTLTVSNQLNCTGTAVTRFELGGTNAPTDYDQLIVSDIHTPAGTLEVVTTNGYVPASGDSFLIISNSAPGGSLFGTFTTANLPALATGLGWVVQYNGLVSVGLLVTGTIASATPYDLWAQSITNPALRGEQEDADGDGSPNLLEYSQGSDATNAADSAKLVLVRSNGQFLAVFNRVNTATDIVYEVEGAYAPTNGASWLGIATNAIGSWGSSTNVNDNNTAAVHQVWVTDLELGTNRTLRLKITRP
jgi:autotransporter-associated beta strand protein